MDKQEVTNLASQADADMATLPAEPGSQAAPGADAAGADVVTQVIPSNDKAVAMLLEAAREGLVSVLNVQSAKITLAPDRCEVAAKAIAPVLDKYGLKLGAGVMGVEMNAIMVAGPIVWGAFAATMAELAERKRAAELRAAGQLGQAEPAVAYPGGPVVPMSVVAEPAAGHG